MVFSLFCLAAGLVAPAQSGSESTTVAVVNVAAVNDGYLRTKALEEQFETASKKYVQDRDFKAAEIEKLTRSLEEEFKPGTADFQQRREQLLLLKDRLEAFVVQGRAKLDASVAGSLQSIYQDIRAMVARIAEERGIDVVLTIEPPPDESPASSNVLRQQIMFQKVIYAAPRAEITEEVLRRLNEEYERGRGKTPGGSAPPSRSRRMKDEG